MKNNKVILFLLTYFITVITSFNILAATVQQTSQRDNANDNSLVALYTIGSNKFLFMEVKLQVAMPS